jgi:hypothetical protein
MKKPRRQTARQQLQRMDAAAAKGIFALIQELFARRDIFIQSQKAVAALAWRRKR